MRFTDIIKAIKNTVLDMIFPRRCVVCDCALGMSEQGVCKKCSCLVHKIKPPYCMKCGKQIKNDEDIYCNDCREVHHYFDEGRSLFLYDDAMKRSMYRFKYNGRYEYADYYAGQLSLAFSDYLMRLKPDVLIPIPIHKTRLKKRGYNQSGLICRVLSKQIKIPMTDQLLIRVDETAKQKNLNVSERQNNLKKAFKTTQNDVKLSTAVLIDDIYTTGATIDAAAACLKRAGVQRVYYLCVCSGRNT